MSLHKPASAIGAQRVLDTITQATTLPYRIPVSGSTIVDAAIVANRIRLASDLYKSAIIGLVGHYNENLPMDRRIDKATKGFLAAVDEITDDLQGSVEHAVEEQS